jgi:hypothetical protein
MQQSFLKSLVFAVIATFVATFSPLAHAQGLVSSGITGSLSDDTGKAIAGATVTAVHTPTNTTYTAITSPSGRFQFSGLRVGGPYLVTGTTTGYVVGSSSDNYVALGEPTEVTLQARSETLQLEKFVVTSEVNALDAGATGAGSVLDNRRIMNQPTSTRSFADMIKTNPFASIRNGQQISALGMNNRYNSISIDGARQNDQFGLSSTGLVSLKNPFSIDALENFSVQIVPYDVTQSGSAGATINAVSKSGTNEFHGSAYYLYTSDKWQGADIYGTTIGQRTVPQIERTWGATLGGPIIKNKLFFFLNYEKVSNPSGGIPIAGFNPDASVVSALTAQYASLPGSPNFGTFGGATANLQEDEKKLAKIDWQITNNHRLTVRYSETIGNQPFFPEFRQTGQPSGFPSLSPAPSFVNGVTTTEAKYYNLAINEKLWASQLFSSWTPNFKTELAFSKNNTDSLRSTPVLLPEIVLLGVPGISSATGAAVTTNTALLLGTDYSSMGNGLITDMTAFSGNGSYTWRNFTFKAGFDHEATDFENLFRNGSYGRFVYNYVPGFNLGTAAPIAFVRNVATSGYPATDVSTLETTGYFAQAKWEPNRRLNITAGLRYDVLGSPIDPPYNPAFAAAFGVRNDATIDGSDQLAPRVSFNYAVDEGRKIQVRGGLGVFLGRVPWVWLSNSYGNAGFGRFNRTITSGAMPTLNQYLGGTYTDTDPAFKFDPANPFGVTNQTTGGGDVAFIKPGLKLPSNLRGNLAVDFKLPFLDSKFTIEYIHNDVMKAIFYDQINLVPGGQGADGRTYFRRYTNATNPTLIPLGSTGGLVNTYNTSFSRVFRFGNTSVGGSDYVALSLERPLKDGWAYNLSYTRGRATEAQAGGSSTASSQWAFNIVFNQGQVEETRSDFEVRDRIQFSVTKEFNFLKRYKTSATLSYEGKSGLPYSYVYSGDLNFDGSTANDALAVPTGVGDTRFDFSGMTTPQRDAYLAYIANSELAKYAGGYAPRNSFIGPWQSRLDLHLSQEIRVVGPVRVELFADFINFGNFVDNDLFNYIDTLGSPNNSNQNVVLGNAAYGADGRIRPSVALNSDGSVVIPTGTQFLPNNTDSRWRIQAGVRLKF